MPRIVPIVPATILGLIIAAAILAPYLHLGSPTATSLRDKLIPPSWVAGGSSSHPLGTDHLGRDVLARVVYGARASLAVAGAVVAISSVVGTAIGMIAGFRGGFVEGLFMRICDVILSLPLILLAIVFSVVFGPSAIGLVIILSSTLWAQYARIARGEALTLRNREFITAAITLGYRDRRIITRHVLPNLVHTIVVVATLQVGTVILMEASLSFLGVGVPPPTPTWGRMIADGRTYVSVGWWVPVFAGGALATVIICTNLIGDWMRDRFDPQMSGRQLQNVV